MFHANCPACGAPVELKSAAAVMTVCSFCKSTLLRDGETLSDIGKMSAVLEDYARVQIGTTGLDFELFVFVARLEDRLVVNNDLNRTILERLVADEPVNEIHVDPETTEWARVALQRMLDIT